MKNVIIAGLLFVLVAISLSIYFKQKAELKCTYAVWVKDKETGKPLPNAKVTYFYNQTYFLDYSDSEGYYKATMAYEGSTCPDVKLMVKKDGYSKPNAPRHITHHLKRIEEVRLEKIANCNYSIFLFNSETNIPISEANISYSYKSQTNFLGKTDSEGFYPVSILCKEVPKAMLQVTKENYENHSRYFKRLQPTEYIKLKQISHEEEVVLDEENDVLLVIPNLDAVQYLSNNFLIAGNNSLSGNIPSYAWAVNTMFTISDEGEIVEQYNNFHGGYMDSLTSSEYINHYYNVVYDFYNKNPMPRFTSTDPLPLLE